MEREALKLALEALESDHPDIQLRAQITLRAVLAQEPVACERCKQLEEQAYDLLGKLKVANLKWSVAHPWVGLTDEEIDALWQEWKDAVCLDHKTWAKAIEAKLKEKNT
jgi:hypothetical protein